MDNPPTPEHYDKPTTPWQLEACMDSSGSVFVDHLRCAAIEYAFRIKSDLLEDLKKARHCLDVAVEHLEAKASADAPSVTDSDGLKQRRDEATATLLKNGLAPAIVSRMRLADLEALAFKINNHARLSIAGDNYGRPPGYLKEEWNAMPFTDKLDAMAAERRRLEKTWSEASQRLSDNLEGLEQDGGMEGGVYIEGGQAKAVAQMLMQPVPITPSVPALTPEQARAAVRDAVEAPDQNSGVMTTHYMAECLVDSGKWDRSEVLGMDYVTVQRHFTALHNPMLQTFIPSEANGGKIPGLTYPYGEPKSMEEQDALREANIHTTTP